MLCHIKWNFEHRGLLCVNEVIDLVLMKSLRRTGDLVYAHPPNTVRRYSI